MEFPHMPKHISHEHRLIFNEAQKDFGETKKVVCYGCLQQINPEQAFFSCRECGDFFLHRTCEELPWQTEHPMHPHALLTLLPHREAGPDSLCLCHVCGRDWERFTYSCGDCKFYVCIFCTMLSKIKHVSHDHLLIPSEVEGNDEEVVCYGCQKAIADHQVHSCSACNFFLHKTCAALPTQVKHYLFHLEHLLTLFPHPPNSGRCNVCEESCKEFTYYCELCNFSACISCVMLDSIQHMSHWHQLFPMEPQITNSEEVVCCGCKKQIANNNAYICRDCNFFLHKTCAELPNAIQHLSHKKHMLTLLPRARYVSSRCGVCKSVWNTLIYNCEVCQLFDTCIACFVLGKIKHPSHDHPIIPMEAHNHDGKEAICYGCRKSIVDDGYSCKDCNFFLHKTCVDLADEIQTFAHPQHPLTLVLQQRWNIRPLHCGCCGESWAWFFYYCELCKFKLCVPCARLSSDLPQEMENAFLHPHSLSLFLRPPRSYSTWTCNCCGERSEPLLYRCNCCEFNICMSCASCALLPQITMHGRIGSSDQSKIEEEEALDSKVIRLPVPGESINQISYLLGTANRGEIQRAEEFTHNSHPHPLILCGDALTKDDELVCSHAGRTATRISPTSSFPGEN
ncbi:hypothetical protein RJ639_040263 [Escallonia herrerae]|uniref:Phorbol-ester/DAG-type domain-containing protein n=1 Tax=Escallonia herrerae TaxID=1293975 RepID=A0AA88WJD4_9ASTE|nr:hypothetical protein RJ639_040263 [Escallonia herrerae]